MRQATVETDDGTKFSVSVRPVSLVERSHFAAKVPEELSNAEDGDEISIPSTESAFEFLIDLATEVTELGEEDLNKMDTEIGIQLCVEIFEKVFGEEQDGNNEERRLRRIRLNSECIELLFCSDASLVSGVPDSATFEDFYYDPAYDELNFIFSSDEWSAVPKDEQIPVIELRVGEIPSFTKEVT